MRKISSLIKELRKFDQDANAFCDTSYIYVMSDSANKLGHIECRVPWLSKELDTNPATVVQHDLNG